MQSLDQCVKSSSLTEYGRPWCIVHARSSSLVVDTEWWYYGSYIGSLTLSRDHLDSDTNTYVHSRRNRLQCTTPVYDSSARHIINFSSADQVTMNCLTDFCQRKCVAEGST